MYLIYKSCNSVKKQHSTDLSNQCVTSDVISPVSYPNYIKDMEKRSIKRVLDRCIYFALLGSITDWKTHFTVAQNEMFDAVYEKKMKDHPDLKDTIQFC